VEELEPRRLVSIPSRSWRGGYEKWLSEKSSIQERIWRNLVEAYEYFKALENSIGVCEEDLVSLMHAVNSDHIWAEFADESFSADWRRMLEEKLENVLFSIRIVGVQDGSIQIANRLDKPVKVLVYRDGSASLVELKPGLNVIGADGRIVRIVVRGWRSEYQVGKPMLVKLPRTS